MNLNLETASVAELDALLKMAVDSDNEISVDMIENVMAELDKRGELRDLTQEEIEQGYNKCIEKIRRTEITERPRKRISGKRFVAAAAVLTVFVTLSISYAYGAGFLTSVLNWTKDAVQYVFGTKDDEDDDRVQYSQFLNMRYELDNLGIDISLPTWLPEGYNFDSVEIANADTPKHITAWFSDGNDFISIKVLEIYDINNSSLSETGDDWKPYIINGTEHFIMTNGVDDALSKVLWIDNGYEITVQGHLTKAQLEMIANSIFEGT